jgi:hypothetical protein
MYNNDTELLFPSRVISALGDQRGDAWRKLVERIEQLPEDTPEHLAFVLMMTRLNNCNTCNSDSFRAMRGCTQCTLQNVRRFRPSDKEFIKLYDTALRDIQEALAKNNKKED